MKYPLSMIESSNDGCNVMAICIGNRANNILLEKIIF